MGKRQFSNLGLVFLKIMKIATLNIDWALKGKSKKLFIIVDFNASFLKNEINYIINKDTYFQNLNWSTLPKIFFKT